MRKNLTFVRNVRNSGLVRFGFVVQLLFLLAHGITGWTELVFCIDSATNECATQRKTLHKISTVATGPESDPTASRDVSTAHRNVIATQSEVASAQNKRRNEKKSNTTQANATQKIKQEI